MAHRVVGGAWPRPAAASSIYARPPMTVAADIQAFHDAGVKINDPIPGGRVQTGGYKLSWVAAFPLKPFMSQVPFFLQDITPS